MKIKINQASWMIAFAFVILSAATSAQKAVNLTLVLQPGITMGGECDMPLEYGNEFSAWTAMQTSSPFGMEEGIDLGYDFSEQLGVSLGFHYAGMGEEYTGFSSSASGSDANVSRNISLKYLKIPVQFHYSSPLSKRISFACSAGFYAGILTSYKDEMIYSSVDSIVGIVTDTRTASGDTYTQIITSYNSSLFTSGTFISKPYRGTDAGAVVSAGILFKLSEKIFLPVMVMYEQGITDVKNASSQFTKDNMSTGNTFLFWRDSDYSSDPDASLAYRNSSLQFKIALKINLFPVSGG